MKHPGMTNKVYNISNDVFNWSEDNFNRVSEIIKKYPKLKAAKCSNTIVRSGSKTKLWMVK